MREKILAVCQHLIQTTGYCCVSIGQIAKVASTTKSNVLHHFGNKDNLVLQTLEIYQTTFEEQFQRIKQEQNTFNERLRSLIELYLKMLEEEQISLPVALMGEIQNLPPELSQQLKALIEAQVDGIQQFSEEKELDREKIKIFLVSLEGIMVYSRLEQDSALFRQLAEALCNVYEINETNSSKLI